MRKNKKRAQKIHTIRRLSERYGIKYSQRINDYALHQIHSGEAIFVFQQSHRVTVWDVSLDIRETDIIDSRIASVGLTTLRFVYDANRKSLVTVLKTDMNPEDIQRYERIG